tara:strand:- start:10403 stop:10669 length:267 start_codon:yes stop_codon:yes gene_type:complete
MKKPKQQLGVWTAHLPSSSKEEIKAKEDFEGYVKNSRGIFDRVVEILEDYVEPEDVTIQDYDCPSWSHKQADRNGYNRAIKKVKALFA